MQSVLRHCDTLKRYSAVGFGESLADSLRTSHVGAAECVGQPVATAGVWVGIWGSLTAGRGSGSHRQMRADAADFYRKAACSFLLTISLSPTVYFY